MIKVGAPVTIVMWELNAVRRTELIHGHVSKVIDEPAKASGGWIAVQYQLRRYATRSFVAEGVFWIRGHYTADSPAGRALLVAFSMAHE